MIRISLYIHTICYWLSIHFLRCSIYIYLKYLFYLLLIYYTWFLVFSLSLSLSIYIYIYIFLWIYNIWNALPNIILQSSLKKAIELLQESIFTNDLDPYTFSCFFSLVLQIINMFKRFSIHVHCVTIHCHSFLYISIVFSSFKCALT